MPRQEQQGLEMLVNHRFAPVDRCRYKLVLLLIAALAACAQATPTPTPTPTPTLTPTSTPLLLGEFNATLDPERTANLMDLLSLVPGDNRLSGFLDTSALRQNPALSEISSEFSLENLGLAVISSPEIAIFLESMVLTTLEPGQELIIVLNGPIDIDRLLQWLREQGVSIAVAPVPHRSYLVWNSDPSSLAALSLAAVNDSTIVLAQGPPGVGTNPRDRVQHALDAFDGVMPRFLDDPEMVRMVNNLPSGFAAVLDRQCAGIFPILDGCTAAGVSSESVGQDMAATTFLALFENEAQATAAMPKILESFGSLEVSHLQKGPLDWVTFTGSPVIISQAFEGFIQ